MNLTVLAAPVFPLELRPRSFCFSEWGLRRGDRGKGLGSKRAALTGRWVFFVFVLLCFVATIPVPASGLAIYTKE